MERYNLPSDIDAVRKLLVGRSVVGWRPDTLILDSGVELKLSGNEGCPGCPSGWYDLQHLHLGPINSIMDVESVTDGDPNSTAVYRLFVLTQDDRIEVASYEGSDGNGFYGTGYWIEVK